MAEQWSVKNIAIGAAIVFAVSIVAIIPVVVLFMLIEKRLVGGLTAGSVK